MTPTDMQEFKSSLAARLEQMTPEERKTFVNQICSSVDKMAKAVVENADAIWQSRSTG